jgi:hypothetical protein
MVNFLIKITILFILRISLILIFDPIDQLKLFINGLMFDIIRCYISQIVSLKFLKVLINLFWHLQNLLFQSKYLINFIKIKNT